jgi:hypothetical protein
MVIDLRNFLGRDTAAGGEAEIFAQVLIPFVSVGKGRFTEVSASKVAFSGRIEAAFYKGDFTLVLELVDGTQARLQVGGSSSESATYTAQGSKLKVEATFPGGKKQGLTFERGGSGGVETYLGLAGAFSANVHLAPRAGAPSVA